MQEKRANVDYRPRLGRRSNEDAEPKPYDVLFTPRMGKRSEVFTNYTPRLGRSVNSGEAKKNFLLSKNIHVFGAELMYKSCVSLYRVKNGHQIM